LKNDKDIEKEIKAKIASFEVDRKKASQKSFIAGIVFLPMAFFFGLMIALKTQHPLPGILMGGFFVGLFFLGNYIAFSDLKIDFKKEVVGALIKQFSPHLSYAPHKYIRKEIFKASNLFQSRITRFKGEDLVSGKIGDTEFQLSELSATKKSGKNTVTVFKGIFIEADFHKYFKSETYIKPDTILKSIGLDKKSWSGARLTHFENAEFEEKFRVFSTNEQDARYIISPTMMERILQLQKRFGSNISISFRGSKMYIAISTGDMDLFDKHTRNVMHTERTYNLVSKEIDFVLSIIDDLNLNTRIWSKQEGLTGLELKDLDKRELDFLDREEDELKL